MRNLQTLAESAQRLSEALKAKYPDVEWRSIAAFRNILVHDYLGVDLERIWIIVQQDVPKLKETIVWILQEIEGNH